MSNNRDPRDDPQPGDIVRLRNGLVRVVVRRQGPVVDWDRTPDGGQCTGQLKHWVRECADATVLYVSGLCFNAPVEQQPEQVQGVITCPYCQQRVNHTDYVLSYHDHPKPCRVLCRGSRRRVSVVFEDDMERLTLQRDRLLRGLAVIVERCQQLTPFASGTIAKHLIDGHEWHGTDDITVPPSGVL